MNKKILAIIILAISISFCSIAFAETIVLKSGKTVEGKMTERTDDHISIDIEGVPVAYFLDDIESIDGKQILVEANEPKTQAESTPAVPETQKNLSPERDYNKDLQSWGIRFSPPEGWILNPDSKENSLMFVDVPGADKENAIISISPAVFSPSPNAFKISLAMMESSMKLTSDGTKTIGNIEYNILDRNIPFINGRIMKQRMYIFFKDKRVFKIFCGAYEDSFDKYLPIFEKSINTYEVIGKGKVDVEAYKDLLLPVLLILLIVYIYFSLCLQIIAKKANQESAWLAWVPIGSNFLMCKIAGIRYWWLLIFLAWPIPILGSISILGFLTFNWYKIAVVLNKPGWIGLLMIIPVVNFIVLGYFAFSKK